MPGNQVHVPWSHQNSHSTQDQKSTETTLFSMFLEKDNPLHQFRFDQASMKSICIDLVEDYVHDSLLVLSTTQHVNDEVMQPSNCLRTC